MGNRCMCTQEIVARGYSWLHMTAEHFGGNCMHRVNVVGSSVCYMYILLPSLFKSLQ